MLLRKLFALAFCAAAVGANPVSTTYAGNDVFPSAITLPSDGDVKPAASVNVALEGLADRTAYLQRHVAQSNVLESDADPYDSFNTTSWVASTTGYVEVDALYPEVILIDASFSVQNVSVTNDSELRLYVSLDGGSTRTPLTGTVRKFSGTNNDFDHVSISTSFTMPSDGTARFGVEGQLTGGTGTLHMQGGGQLIRAVRVGSQVP